MFRIIWLAIPLALIAAFVSTWSVSAGDLNPPPGPIMPTGRDVLNAQSISLPFTITQPGSYRLTSNLVAPANADGIVIDADNVTLDLNGFELVGMPGTPAFGRGVNILPARKNVRVRNGIVRNWSQGISGSGTVNCHLENLIVLDCDNSAINTGDGGLIVDCQVENAAFGILSGANASIRGCVVRGTTIGPAISTGAGGLIESCTASGAGSIGIVIGNGRGRITDCVATGNGSSGIAAAGASTISGCTSTFNGGHGIDAVHGHVSDCLTQGNELAGIFFQNFAGAVAGGSATHNTCIGDSLAGILVQGSRVRLDGNTATQCGRGFDIDGPNNTIIRNSAGENLFADYDVVGGNVFGPVVNAATVGGNTNPHANYEM